MKPLYIEGQTCPKCGRQLIIREGEFGDFLACPRFPACRFTKPLPDGEIKEYSPSPYCKECKHTGLKPFIKNGRIIPHAQVDCDCKNLLQHHEYRPPEPTDFDYPCSDTFREHSYLYCNRPDPGYIAPEPTAPPPQVTEVIHRHSNMSQNEFALLRNLEGQVKYLQGKLVERQVRKQPKPSGYKGIK